jgi:peptidyl-prolyl cis-trans isomerase SurA
MRVFSRFIFVSLALMCWSGISFAQSLIIDQITAVVGSNVILQSDIESQYQQMRSQGFHSSGDMKCEVFEDLLVQKLLLNQAKIDSVEVSESQVEMQLNQRLEFFINQIGSEEKLEAYFNKTILEIKDDFRDLIRDQLVTQRMQGDITEDVNVTPSETRRFFNSMHTDSIPLVNAQVEYQQIVLYPPFTDEAIFDVKERLLNIRKRIVDGENFTTLAVLYSEDPGSATRGGEIGFASRADLDPEYAKAAFALKDRGVSKIVESEFGYHIIQLIERRGDRVNTRHILMKPKINPEAMVNVRSRADSLVSMLKVDSISFENAARLFSGDKQTRVNGGLVVNQMNGNTRFELDKIPVADFNVIRGMNVAEVSSAYETRDERGQRVIKIIKLKSRTEPHRANLKDDYLLLQEMALADKKSKVLNDWIEEKQKSTYIHIDDSYKNCQFEFKGWVK